MYSILTPGLWGLAVLLLTVWVGRRASLLVSRDIRPMLLLCCAGMGVGLAIDLQAGSGPVLTSICGQHLPLSQSLPWLLSNLPASNAGMLLAPLLGWALRRRPAAAESDLRAMLHALLMAPAMLIGMNLAMAWMPTARGPYPLQLTAMVLAMTAGMAVGMLAMETTLVTYRRVLGRKAA